MREAILAPAARAYRDMMSDAERVAADRCIARLEGDATPDGRTTLAVPDVPGFFLYDDGMWRIAYTVPDGATVVIRSIAHVLDLHD
jgi:hypothetical protein